MIATRAMTMIEVILAMVLLSMLLGAVLSGVELSARTQQGTVTTLRAETLASDLLEEICSHAYADPGVVATPTIGVDLPELASDRSTFDDVDDYHNWSETPAQYADGTALAGASGWTRSVSVFWVDPESPTTKLGSESGAKLVVVQVSLGGVIYTELTRLRTAAWDQAVTGD